MVGVVGIGIGEDLGFGNRLEQAKADHRRRHPRADHGALGERAIAEVDDAVFGHSEADGLAAGKGHRLLLVVDLDLTLGLVPLDRQVLKLAAIGRLGDRIQLVGGQLGLVIVALSGGPIDAPAWSGCHRECRR